MKPRDLLATARILANANKNRPRQTDLKRAASTAYYALFHQLAESSADAIAGTKRSDHSWRHVYRALDHGFARTACANKDVSSFPQAIRDFANTFVTMQFKRHQCDYDPFQRMNKSDVLADIRKIEKVIDGFEKAANTHKRAFAIWVHFKRRD